MLEIIFVLVKFIFEMLKVHFDFLLESNMAANGGLKFLGLVLETLVVKERDEVGLDKLYEIID